MSDTALPGLVFALKVCVVVLDPGVDFLQGAPATGVREKGLGDQRCVGDVGLFNDCGSGCGIVNGGGGIECGWFGE